MWETLEGLQNSGGTVEYGIFQRDRKPNSLIWRRHGDKGERFENLHNALYGKCGAFNACIGVASYPKHRYADGAELLVPYIATWLMNTEYAYLIRASAGDPEITLIEAREIDVLSHIDESALSVTLANIFADGASRFGVRLLNRRGIREL